MKKRQRHPHFVVLLSSAIYDNYTSVHKKIEKQSQTIKSISRNPEKWPETTTIFDASPDRAFILEGAYNFGCLFLAFVYFRRQVEDKC